MKIKKLLTGLAVLGCLTLGGQAVGATTVTPPAVFTGAWTLEDVNGLYIRLYDDVANGMMYISANGKTVEYSIDLFNDSDGSDKEPSFSWVDTSALGATEVTFSFKVAGFDKPYFISERYDLPTYGFYALSLVDIDETSLIKIQGAAPVPVPGAIILLGSGLCGLVALRKKSRSSE